MASFCVNCGAPRGAGAYCGNCGTAYDQAPASARTSVEPSLARGLITVQNLQAKLVIGRFIGVIVGLTIWALAVGPALSNNILASLVGLFVLAYAGLFIGGRLVLEIVAGR